MSPLLRPVLGAVLLLLVPSIVLAQGTPAPAPAAQPPAAAAQPADAKADPDPTKGGGRLAVCRADVAKLCPDATKGSGDRVRCLRENTAKLSPECATAFADLEAKAKAMREACATDVQTHCAAAGKGKGKGGDGITQCLRANEAKLTPACNTAIQARFPKGQ